MKIEELTEDDIKEWKAAKAKAEAEPIPTEEEEQEAAGFKRTVMPKMMTPDQVRKGAPVSAVQKAPATVVPTSQYEDDEEGQGSRWPDHQSISLKRQPHESTWEEGIYEVTIERTWQDTAPDMFHTDPQTGEALTAVFLHVGFITEDGQRIQKRMSMCPSGHEKCFKTKMLISIFGDPAPEDISTDDLVGKKLQVFIENIKNRKGDIWPTVTKTVRSTKQFQTAGE